MSKFRKLHISLTQEGYQAVRKFAFECETTISHVLDYLIEENLIGKDSDGNPSDTAIQKSNQAPEVPQPSVPSAWSVSSIPRNG